MTPASRRRFLQLVSAGVASTGLSWFVPRAGVAAGAPTVTRVLADPRRTVAPLDRRLFGSFLEHIGRAIYEGIYQPGSPLADERGFRKDVTAEIRELGVPIVRYPGGNFVSGYNWRDGVGPRSARPRLLERAWNSIETNQFGTNEFVDWCRAAGTEPLFAVNLGSGTPAQAAELVEYCNVDRGTKLSDLRRQHGWEKPHNIKNWCLGNEMDGPWQIGHMTAREYGRKAGDAARQMRVIDKSLQLVACGSSGPSLPTWLEWDMQVLEECYRDVDGLSLHRYFSLPGDSKNDSANFLSLNLAMERQIKEVAAVCDVVRGRLRVPRKIWLSFDEWNVWYKNYDGNGKRQVAPHLLEEVYNLLDALLVGGMLNTLIRQADRVRIGCLAQLVNVIAPLLTNDTSVVRQTIYYPYAWALKFARGQALDLLVEGDVAFENRDVGTVPYIDIAGTWDSAKGTSTLFLLNRDLEQSRDVEITWRDQPPTKVVACQTLTGKDLRAANDLKNPRNVLPQQGEPPQPGPRMTLKIPAQSYSVLQLGHR